VHPGRIAETRPDKPAVVMSDTGAALTYGDLHHRAERLADHFQSLGLAPGDHIAFCIENGLDFFSVMWGAHYAGLYYTAISTHLTPPEIAYIVEDSGSAVFIASNGLAVQAEAVVDLTPTVRARFSVGGPIAGHEALEPIATGPPRSPTGHRTDGRDMLYSSGTTGRPKGVKAPLSGPDVALGEADDSLVALLGGVFGADDETVYLSPAPLYHAAPLRFCRTVQKLGGTVVVMARFDAADLLSAIEDHQVTLTQMVPTMFVRCLKLDQGTRARHDLSSLRAVVHAAAPCPVDVKRRMIEWWGPIVHEYYAGTEGQGFVYCNSEQWLTHEGTVGLPLVGTIHIVDDDGRELPAGEVGTVYFESDRGFEYHNDPAKTAGVTHERGWTTLGDVGHLDDDGYLYLSDRKAFTIISGGVNVYPQEAENVLVSHPAVADAAVFGVPDEDLGEVVKAVVEPSDPTSAGPDLERELIDFCRGRLAREKCPRTIDFRDELPRSPTGKLYKRLLRDEYLRD
jgi:acyl-CoA synthetase (AMP-forming)/AMP-acid ligase II